MCSPNAALPMNASGSNWALFPPPTFRPSVRCPLNGWIAHHLVERLRAIKAPPKSNICATPPNMRAPDWSHLTQAIAPGMDARTMTAIWKAARHGRSRAARPRRRHNRPGPISPSAATASRPAVPSRKATSSRSTSAASSMATVPMARAPPCSASRQPMPSTSTMPCTAPSIPALPC